jgi:hypothetical protein
MGFAITPPHSAPVLGLHPNRDTTLTQIERLGLGEWKRRVGYHQRSRVEAGAGAGSVATC